MASIKARPLKNGKMSYRVQIRIHGARPISKTFNTKTAAKEFAQATEADLKRGLTHSDYHTNRNTLGAAIDLYIECVPSGKMGQIGLNC